MLEWFGDIAIVHNSLNQYLQGFPSKLHHHIIAIHSIASTFLVVISVFTVTAVSVDRYLAIHCHLRYQDLVTGRKVLYFQMALWSVCEFYRALGRLGFVAI